MELSAKGVVVTLLSFHYIALVRSATSSSPIATTEDENIICYSCTYSQGQEIAFPCVNEPWNVTTANITPCPPGRSCFTQSNWDLDGGALWNFGRGCMPTGHFPTGCSKDSTREVCYSFCTTDFCNTDDGRPVPTTRPPPTDKATVAALSGILTLLPVLLTVLN